MYISGVWFFHCHLEVHLPWGLGMAFLVENGGTPDSTLPPPPADILQCKKETLRQV
ncbi:putative laccase [Helianthus anomalus]